MTSSDSILLFLSSNDDEQSSESECEPMPEPRRYPRHEASVLPDWCRNPCYDRYWKHRMQVEQWFHKHLLMTEPIRSSSRRSGSPLDYWSGYSQARQQYDQADNSLAQYYYNSMQYWQQRYYSLLNSPQSHPDLLYSPHSHSSSRRMSYPDRTVTPPCDYFRGQSEAEHSCSRRNRRAKTYSSCSSTEPKQDTNKRVKSKHSKAKKHVRRELVEDEVMGDIIFDVDSRLLQDSHDEEVIECHMEITDEMVDFFAQSARHRKERDEQKKQEKNKKKDEDIFVDFSKAAKGGKPTTAPPSVRPGQKRTAEMKMLYGKGAAMIHGMETAMQLNYDRHLDMKQPKHWPHLPLNIKFAS